MSGEGGRPTRGRRRRARHPGLRLLTSASPVRGTDRLEDLVAWVLVALGLLAALGAVLVGRAAHDATLGPDGVGTPAPIRAVLLADVPAPPTSGRPMVRPLPPVPVSFTADDGTEQIGELAVRAPAQAGTAVMAWLDEEGRLTPTPPQHTSEAVAFGVGAGVTVAGLVWALLALVWSGVCRVTAARNDAAWECEWAHVEPVWSRRVR
jgi:hypothetical protein